MARIPVPAAGSVGFRVTGGGETGAVGHALQGLGQTAMQAAGNQQAQQQAQDRQAAYEAKQQAAEDQHTRDAANKAQATSAMNGLRDSLIDAHDEIAQGIIDGTVPKDKAAEVWQERTKSLASGLDAVPDAAHRQLVQMDFEQQSARMGNRLRQAVTKRDRQDVTAGLDSSLEFLSRQYQGDPAGTTQKAMAAIEQLGPFSDYNPQQRQAKAQAWQESTQYAAGFELVGLAKNSPALLDKAEAALSTDRFANLDPQRRASLGVQIDGHRVRLQQQAEIAAQRAARQQEAALNKAKAEFDTFQTLSDKGGALSPEYIDRVSKATAGTPYAAGIKGLLDQAKAVGGLASQPITVQQATLDTIDAHINQHGRSPEADKRREQVARVVKASQSDLQADPMRAALERGVIDKLEPLNMSGGMAGMFQQLGARVYQANTVQQWAGRAVSPLTDDEAQSVGRMLGTLSTDQRAPMLATLSSAIGPQQASALAAQIDKTDRPLGLALAVGATMTTASRPVSAILLKGQQALADKTVKEDTTLSGWRAEASKYLGDAVAGKAREDVLDAAKYINAGLEAEGGGDIQRAVRMALGGAVIEHNGRKIPVGGNLSESDFLAKLPDAGAKLAGQTPDGMVMAGGHTMPLAQFVDMLPAAQLEPAGMYRYRIRAGGVFVTNSQRQPLVLEVR